MDRALLHDWGFNTAGCWSRPSVWPDFYVAEQIYVDFRPHAHDVFDAAFWQGPYADHLREEVKPFRGKTNVIGYFLDNEPAWNAPHIFAFYLRLGKHTPGSQALLAYLHTYYQGRIRLLNQDWGTWYAALRPDPGDAGTPTGLRRVPGGMMQAWRTKVVATYYQRYAAMVRALDPEHLILGIRYKGVPERALFTALSPYFDVNSINDYTRSGHLKPVYAALYQITGKPLMITEFSFRGFRPLGSPRPSASRWGRRPSVASAITRTWGRRPGRPSWWGCMVHVERLCAGGPHGRLSSSA